MNKNVRVHVFLFIANLIYGVSFTVAKFVVPDFVRPFGAIIIRVSVSALLFLLAHQLFIREKIKRKDIPLLLACGLFGVAINQLLFFKGLSLTTPVHGALIMVTTPVIVLILSSLWKDEAFTWQKGIGILLGAAGACTVALSGENFSFKSEHALGDLFIFINAASYAVYIVIVKPLMKKYDPLTVIKWVFLFGFCFVLPVGWNEFAAIEWNAFNPEVWMALSFLVIATTFLAYLLNIIALKDASPSIVGVYIYAQPVLATLFALMLGKDKLVWEEGLAAFLIFSGVYLVSREKRENPAGEK